MVWVRNRGILGLMKRNRSFFILEWLILNFAKIHFRLILIETFEIWILILETQI